jgi:hypothetical protein
VLERPPASLLDTYSGFCTLFFERAAYKDGIVIQCYHTDNGVFTSKEFLQEFLNNKQTIRFSGSSAAHQSGDAERWIQTVVNMARTMMLHAAMRSLQGYVRTEHWPMAMDHAVWICNHLAAKNGFWCISGRTLDLVHYSHLQTSVGLSPMGKPHLCF